MKGERIQMPNNLLEIQDLTKEFRIGGMLSRKKMRAVDGVSFSLPGDRPVILAVVGESGCGKTTLTKMVLRLLTPTSGRIVLDGQNCLSRREIPDSRFRTLVQPIFQNPFDSFSTRRQVIKYLMDTARTYGGAKSREEAVQAVSKALKSVGLSYEVVDGKYSTQFSGGELQRISIARALITSPKIIIADEPVAMIDASLKINIVNLFKQLKDEYGISFIYITHDLSTAYYVSDYIATLYRGNLIEYGPSKDIMEKPAHPYTDLLMSSVPHVGERWARGVRMTDAETREYTMTCCRFSNRCPYATEECRRERPAMTGLGGERKVLCYHPLVKAEK